MTFRRGFPARRASFARSNFRSSFRRFQPLGRLKNKTTRVQRCNFFVSSSTTISGTTGLQATNFAIELATIRDHIGDELTPQGRALAAAAKSIDITSIHLTWGIDFDQFAIDFNAHGWQGTRWATHVALAVDRLDANSLPAAAAVSPWFSTQAPMVAVSATDPTLGVVEPLWPQRVLWEKFDDLDFGLNRIDNVPEGALVQTNPRVRGRGGGVLQRKIRCRVTDDEALYWIFSFAPFLNLQTSVPIRRWIGGAFFYTVNF